MELKAIVPFGEGEAHYLISPETNGIYQARLVNFIGEGGQKPPHELILVRGYRQWSGSYERQDLLNELGNFIESRSRENRGSPES